MRYVAHGREERMWWTPLCLAAGTLLTAGGGLLAYDRFWDGHNEAGCAYTALALVGIFPLAFSGV